MSIQNPLPVSIVQMGLVEKIVEVAQNQPVVQQQVAQEAALKQFQDRPIEPTQSPEPGSDIKAKDKEQQRREKFQAKKRKEQEHQPEPESDEPREPANPLSGILINRKV